MADPSCDLRVEINCCSRCRAKARNKLKKINGATSVVCDDVKRIVTLSGDVDMHELIDKIASWGKAASVLSFKENSKPQTKNPSDNAQSHFINGCFCTVHHKGPHRDATDYEVNSDSSEENEEDLSEAALLKNEKILTWQHPSLKKNKTKKMEETKKSGQEVFLDLSEKKDSMKPHFCSPTTMYGGVVLNPHFHPYNTIAPPHPYGCAFWSPWMANAMVRFTSYADNYTPTDRNGSK